MASVLERWQPLRIEGTTPEGRTKPLIIGCARQEGSAVHRASFIAKCIGFPEVTPVALVNEVFGHMAAAAVGVRTSTAALIDIDEPFADVVNRFLGMERRPYRISEGTAFGCEQLSGIGPVGRDPHLTDAEFQEAQRIYGLDLLIQNPDRLPHRPNCGRHGGGILAYDFDQAFSFRYLIGSPADPCAVSSHGLAKGHIFYGPLRKKSTTWSGFASDVSAMTESWASEIREVLPEKWRVVAEPICAHLSAVAGRAPELERELVRSLA